MIKLWGRSNFQCADLYKMCRTLNIHQINNQPWMHIIYIKTIQILSWKISIYEHAYNLLHFYSFNIKGMPFGFKTSLGKSWTFMKKCVIVIFFYYYFDATTACLNSFLFYFIFLLFILLTQKYIVCHIFLIQICL